LEWEPRGARGARGGGGGGCARREQNAPILDWVLRRATIPTLLMMTAARSTTA